MSEATYELEVGLAWEDGTWTTDTVEVLIDLDLYDEEVELDDIMTILASEASIMAFPQCVGAWLHHWNPDDPIYDDDDCEDEEENEEEEGDND